MQNRCKKRNVKKQELNRVIDVEIYLHTMNIDGIDMGLISSLSVTPIEEADLFNESGLEP